MARYGTMEAFGVHLGRTGLAMGVEKAKRLIFLSDGLRANWQICLDHFPGALQILDFYHASERLGEFCNLYKNPEKGQQRYEQWYQMFLDGEALQVIAEMKGELKELSSKHDTDGQDQRLPRIPLPTNPAFLHLPMPQEGCLMTICQGGSAGSGIPTQLPHQNSYRNGLMPHVII